MQQAKISEVIKAIREDSRISSVVEVAAHTGASFFLVGGWIRDRLIGKSSQDYDFVVEGDTAAMAEAISKAVGGSCFIMGHELPPNHRIVGPDFTIDIAPLHPKGIQHDLRRRDFTINTMAFSFVEEKFLDPLKGLKGVENRTICLVTPEALDADPLRMLRAIRLSTVLEGFSLDRETAAEVRKRPQRLLESANERIRDELDRIMLSGRAYSGLSSMNDLGLLQPILPELLPLSGLDQGPYHHLDAFRHTLQVVRECDDLSLLTDSLTCDFQLSPEDRITLSYAGLLHDIGKAQSRSIDPDGRPHFYGHEKIGENMAGPIMKRLCFPNIRGKRIKRLIRYHVIGLGLINVGHTPKALRRIVRKLGEDLPLHVLLSLADRRSARCQDYTLVEQKTISLGKALLATYREEGEELLDLPKLVDGEDAMKILGLDPGPAVGTALRKVRDLQVDQAIRSREEALAYLAGLRDETDSGPRT